MFGMTKKQFLRKSKDCLKKTGIELLLIREIFTNELKGNLIEEKAHKKLEIVRKNIEMIFFEYESLKPPSKCQSLHRNILNTIIILQEALVINSEYLLLIKEGSEEKAMEKYEVSLNELERFREQFRQVNQDVDKYLVR
jgi:hypothetical protein